MALPPQWSLARWWGLWQTSSESLLTHDYPSCSIVSVCHRSPADDAMATSLMPHLQTTGMKHFKEQCMNAKVLRTAAVGGRRLPYYTS